MNAIAGRFLTLLLALALPAAAAQTSAAPKDPLEPARAALRTLRFDEAIRLLGAAADAGSADAQYLLGLMYLNGVGTLPDVARGRALLRAAAGRGQGPAAYVLAAELARDPDAPPGESHQWLERSADARYPRAMDALKSGRPLLDRETLGASDPALLMPWVMDCARRDDAAELRRLGAASARVTDDFGRGALAHAAAAGSLEAAAALLDLGAGVRAADAAGVTALMIAAGAPDPAMVRLLLERGADVQAVDAERRTALFYAARGNRSANIAALQAGGALLDARDSRGYDALDAALGVGAQAAAADLRAAGLRVNRVTVDSLRENGKFDPAHPGELYRGWPPLALAVARNDTATVQQLLEAGGDPNLRLPQGDILLQVAADAQALPSIRLLLAHGAQAHAPGGSGHGVLWLAAARNESAVIKALLQGGVQPDEHVEGESTPLLGALRAAHPEAAQALLAAGAGIDRVDAQGRTPLMLACAGGDAAMVQALLGRNPHVDAADAERRTALWYAAAGGSREAVMLMLGAGANAQAADRRGVTVLQAAAANGAAAVMAALLELKLPVNPRDDAGDTALLIAAATGHIDAVRALLAQAPALNLQNAAGDTALIAASRGGHAAICRLLLAAGADKSLRNGVGVSADDVAAARGFAAVVHELANSG